VCVPHGPCQPHTHMPCAFLTTCRIAD
jgi:hypothetical protein